MTTLTRTIMSIRIKTIPVSPEHSPSIGELVGTPAPEVGELNHMPSSITRPGGPQPKITELMRVLQFGDSVLPVGAFSFSNGLESAIQHHLVHDRETLRQFVRTATRQSASADAIALLAAHRAASAHEMTGVLRADTALFNRKMNEEMRTMTVRMGKKLGELSNHLIHTPLLMDWLGHVERKDTPGTYPVSLGLLFAELGLPEYDAFAVQQYGTASMILSASLRLMKIHHFDAQTILFEVNASTETEYERVSRATLDEMATFSPSLDIMAAAHVKAHVRMFMN
ncbi:MAG TPA: urease accessory protein UreF [Nitrospiraceae bacterium]|nr:urease accessory protein UreF [Nitrospiraceae bacterium]